MIIIIISTVNTYDHEVTLLCSVTVLTMSDWARNSSQRWLLAQFFQAVLSIQTLSFLPSCRWEALQVHVGLLRLAFRSFGWADASLPEAHGRQTLPVRRLLALLFQIRPPCPAHEETPELAALAHALRIHKHCLDTHKALTPTTTFATSCLMQSLQTFHWHHSSSWCCYHVLKLYDSPTDELLLT